MKLALLDLTERYWDGRWPTVAIYDEVVKTLSEDGKLKLDRKIFGLAFSYWDELPRYYRVFILRLYKHDRQMFLDLLLKHSPLGKMRYPLTRPKMLIKMFHLLEATERRHKPSNRQLAFSMLLIFDFPYAVTTLAIYLSKKSPNAEEVLMLAGLKDLYDNEFNFW